MLFLTKEIKNIKLIWCIKITDKKPNSVSYLLLLCIEYLLLPKLNEFSD